jgi:Protein of unknown function (DUF3667)
VGRYCHICGQENVEIKESFWHLATHLIYDIMHFDSKFFDTLKYLLFRPGFLTKEYLRGRRASYLHPIRMYVFTSAIFFIIFFSFVVKQSETGIESNASANIGKAKKTFDEQIIILQDSLKRTTDPRQRKKIEEDIDGLKMASSNIKAFNKSEDSTEKKDTDNVITLFGKHPPKTIKEYDSTQQKLPEKERDNWFERILMYRTIAINQKYKGDTKRFEEDLAEKFKHSVPQMMFVSLPLLALVLQLLYIRRRKHFFYVDHLILLIHVYIAIFISLLIYYAFDGLHSLTNFSLFGWLTTIMGIYVFLYGFMAMKNFYKQRIFKTFFKYFILLFVGSILTALLMVIFAITSFFEV